MTIEAQRKFFVASCNCRSTFQGVNLKKYLQNLKAKGVTGHGKDFGLYYCLVCNEFGEEGEAFPHASCRYVRLAKGDMLYALKRKAPPNREALLKKAEEAASQASLAGEKEKETKDQTDLATATDWCAREVERVRA